MIKKNQKIKSKKNLLSSKLILLLAGIAFGIGSVTALQQIKILASEPNETDPCLNKSPALPASSPELLVDTNFDSALTWSQKGGYINDITCLNPTKVFGIVAIKSEADAINALKFAKERKLKVAMAGVKHSMGGQAFAPNALILDMRSFNQLLNFDEADQTITVQPGITWHDVQNKIHPKYSVIAMQSSDIFTVGGSISVNAHGMDHHAGSVGRSIQNLKVLTADGKIQEISATQNPDLFRHVLGGYGLFGIILEAKIKVTPNQNYLYKHELISTDSFSEYFSTKVINDNDLKLFYGHLSTAPHNLLDEVLVHRYELADDQILSTQPLAEASNVALKRFTLNFSKLGGLARELKWFAETKIDPILAKCNTTRTQSLGEGEACLVSRNEPMHDSVPYIMNSLPKDADILHEYYVPLSSFPSFVSGMRNIFKSQDVTLLNASIRVVHKEDMALSYASEDRIAIVLYINQKTDKEGVEKMSKITNDLIDLALKNKGTFFLPYQLHYTPEQLSKGYPVIQDFFKAKRQYDPEEIFTNTFYQKYGQT